MSRWIAAGYRVFMLAMAAYWLGAAWVAFDQRVPLHSRVSRSGPVGERVFYGCSAAVAAALLLRCAFRDPAAGSGSWIRADLASLRRAGGRREGRRSADRV